MTETRVITFSLVAVSAAFLHGAMYVGRLALPMSLDANVVAQPLLGLVLLFLNNTVGFQAFSQAW
jgi:hypothetical protein